MSAIEPTIENQFHTTPLNYCVCDDETRCEGFDTEAEERYWMARFAAAPAELIIEIDALAYELGDPKIFDLKEVDA